MRSKLRSSARLFLDNKQRDISLDCEAIRHPDSGRQDIR